MATLPVTITDKEGNVRVEDGSGNVISSTPAKKKTSGGTTVTTSSSVQGTSVGVQIDPKTGKRTTITKSFSSSTPEVTRKVSGEAASAPPSSAPQVVGLPEGAERVGESRIRYKGLTYNEDVFYSMLEGGQSVGVQDAPNKEEIVYKSKLSSIIQDEQGAYNPATGEITLFAPKGSSAYGYISGVLMDTPKDWKAREVRDGVFVIEELGYTEMRLGHFDIPVNEGTVSAPPSKQVDLGPIISTPLPRSSGRGGGSVSSIRQKESEINQFIDDSVLGGLKTATAEMGGFLEKDTIVTRMIAEKEPIKGVAIIKPFIQNTVASFGAMPAETSKLVLTTGLKLSEADIFNYRPSWAPNNYARKQAGLQVIQEDVGAVGIFAGAQILSFGGELRKDPIAASAGFAYWGVTEAAPMVVAGAAWMGGLEGAGRIIGGRLKPTISTQDVNVVQAQWSADGKYYTMGRTYAEVTAKTPLSSQTAYYSGSFNQVAFSGVDDVTGALGKTWTAQTIGDTRGVIQMGKNLYPVGSQYAISPQVTIPASYTPGSTFGLGGAVFSTPGTAVPEMTFYRSVSGTIIGTGEGAKATIWAGAMTQADDLARLFPVEGVSSFRSFGYSTGYTTGPTQGISYTWKPPLMEGPSVGVMAGEGAGGASVGGGGAAQLVLRETVGGPIAIPRSLTQGMTGLASSAATVQSAAMGGQIGRSLGQLMGNLGSVATLGGMATKTKTVGVVPPQAQVITQPPETVFPLAEKVKLRSPQVISPKAESAPMLALLPIDNLMNTPRTGTPTTTKTGIRTDLVPGLRTTPDLTPDLGTPQITIPITVPMTGIGGGGGSSKTPPPFIPEEVVPPFGGDFGLAGFPDFGGGMRGGGRQPKGYTPSLGGILLGATTPSAPSGMLSGLEIRGVVTPGGGRKRKKRQSNFLEAIL